MTMDKELDLYTMIIRRIGLILLKQTSSQGKVDVAMFPPVKETEMREHVAR